MADGKFNVLPTVHLNIILVTNQLNAQILFYNKSIIFLYMFRALLCSSSGGKNYITQPSGAQVRLCTGRLPTECDDTRCCIIHF